MQQKSLTAYLLFVLLLLLLCIEFYNYQFFQLPYGVHEWANSDRLALAFGFYDTGMNFFLPSTYNQSPIKGITGHEFPIQSYLAAVLGHVFGRSAITQCYRGVDIAMLCTGLFCLFAAVYKRTKTFVYALIAPVLVLASPMFVDYSGGFLPDPFSASLLFVAFYWILDYQEQKTNRLFRRVVFFLTLATLVKTSAVIYFAGFLLLVFINLIALRKTKKAGDFIGFFLVSLLSLSAIAGYYFYNGYLNKKYNSGLFLSRAMPFESIEDLNYYFTQSFQHNWMDQYFILPAYLFLLTVIVAATVAYHHSASYRARLRLGGLFLLTLLPVFWMMGHQMHIHDYYAICIFFPIVIWMLLISVLALQEQFAQNGFSGKLKRGVWAALLLLYCFADFSIYQRLDPGNPREMPFTRVKWMKNGAALLDSLHIAKSAHIVALEEDAPNRTLVYFDRKGYNYPWGYNQEAIIEFMKERSVRYAVCETYRVNERRKSDSTAFGRFQLVHADERATVFLLPY